MSDPVQGSVEGRSFTRCSQLLACLMVLGVLWQGWLALNQPGSEPLDRTTSVLLGLGLLSLLACLVFILTSRTCIDDTHIRLSEGVERLKQLAVGPVHQNLPGARVA